ncbi:DEAD/DEAH box helicase [Oceanimonas pelagia]|uniref:DEAD/DEAH box helicase n=1 Tax=Oceanimonas pelagia TaxID=3028314 RepID=A0AA50KMC3_9GAMM|nr:DEAD/DEAH box helicase [Oceanimonas pelagia]WMC09557.1 DEAD/DEAH box helicase [Oceanimonas pelagia]
MTSKRKPAASAAIPNQPTWVDVNELKERRETLSLRDYQKTHLARFFAEERKMDLSHPGTGKTCPAAVYMYGLWASEGIKSIWAMPKSLLVKNWEELLLWSNFMPDDVVIFDGNPKQRDKQMATDAKVFLMGFDAFARNWRQLLECHPQIQSLVVDEWHLGFSTHGWMYRGKVHGAKRTLEMYQAMRRIPWFLPMTGTLIDGRLNSAYPAINVIEPRYYGTYDNFMATHALLDDYGKPWLWKNHEHLAQILMKHSVRVTFEDAYGAENKQVFVELCTMSPAQRRAYAEMEETALLELEDGFIEAGTPAVAVMRCRQIMQHPETFGIPMNSGDTKPDHLRVHIQSALDANKALVIFEVTREAQNQIVALAESLGAKVGLLNGTVTGNARAKADSEFRSRFLDVMVCSPEVAGVGFNWSHVDTLIFNSIDYQDSSFIQAYRRALRGKRDTPLKIYVLQYRNSIDQRIAHIANSKSKDRTKVFKDDTQVHIVQSNSMMGGDFMSG